VFAVWKIYQSGCVPVWIHWKIPNFQTKRPSSSLHSISQAGPGKRADVKRSCHPSLSVAQSVSLKRIPLKIYWGPEYARCYTELLFIKAALNSRSFYLCLLSLNLLLNKTNLLLSVTSRDRPHYHALQSCTDKTGTQTGNFLEAPQSLVTLLRCESVLQATIHIPYHNTGPPSGRNNGAVGESGKDRGTEIAPLPPHLVSILLNQLCHTRWCQTVQFRMAATGHRWWPGTWNGTGLN
jgi:hypothetical protein